jgi:hypothetical protein
MDRSDSTALEVINDTWGIAVKALTREEHCNFLVERFYKSCVSDAESQHGQCMLRASSVFVVAVVSKA